jgi:hypothetical protein
MMSSRHSDPKILNKEIKRLHKLQEQRDRRESRVLDEERDIARRNRVREIKPLAALGLKRKITFADEKGNKYTVSFLKIGTA